MTQEQMARLRFRTVARIFFLRARGHKQEAISRITGVGQSTISRLFADLRRRVCIKQV